MARKIVDIGVSGNDGTGDSIREAFRKTNENFSELYAVFGQGGFLKFTDLSDTPDTLVGQGNKLPVVNAIGTSLVFKDFFSPAGTIQFDFSEAETFDILSVSRASNIATVTLTANHNLDPGQRVSVASTDNTSFNTASALLLEGTAGAVLVYSNSGTTISTTSAAGTVSSYGSIKIDTLSSRLEDDPLPKLQYGLNASNQLVGGLRSPVNQTEFQTAVNSFNTAHGTLYNIDSFAINKGYADAKYVNINGDTMTGHLNVPANASGNQAPRAAEVVLKSGGDMTGILNLADHPGGLAGAGTPNGVDDLQAATKYYVDSSSYSSNYSLFVTTSGDDTQARTPRGKEGRDRSYAYASINKACQKAEQLVNEAPWETGPYRQLIAYGNGAAFSEVTKVEAGAAGTTRIYFTNAGGSRVDQGKLPKPDIVSGKIVVGRTSGAQGFIYQYYGADGSSTVGEDYFDLQDVIGEFVPGENLEFDQAVKKIQISVIIESGIYFEDYPIRIPPNVAIVGDELRRVIVRPADRPSRSPWVDVWFRRDKTFDGLELTSTEYGYHYLTDPSDPLSEPKNNRDNDVFLCNDAVIIRQITCQGHGGFMMVLDPEGQILSKSAYVQQAGSFAGSLNKQRFAGGQFVDGFAGNNPVKIIEKLSDTEFIVTGSERAPTTPCSFVVDGRTFKVEAYTDDGTGYGGARQLIRRNIDFIKAEVIGYINSELSPPFQFNATKCARDIGLIVDALGYDLALGTNFNAVRAGQAYYRGTQYNILDEQKDEYLDALIYTRTLISDVLAGNSVARLRAEASFDEITDIIANGVIASDTVTWTNPSGSPASRINSKELLLDNINFIREEVIAFLADEYPDFVYDEDKCRRDTETIINSVVYDILYEGNSATVEAGLQYYDGTGSLQIPGQTLQTTAALAYASGIAQLVVTNTPVPFPKQQAEDQVFDLGNPGSSTESARIGVLMGYINTIILGGKTAAPAFQYPSFTGIAGSLTDSRTLLLQNKESIKSDTIVYLDQRYSYNQDTCARDTGYICDAIAHDIYYNGNLKTVQAALAYFNASASSKIVIDTQLANTLAAINYIETLILNVINNQDPINRYQTEVLQFIDTDITDGGLAAATVGDLFNEFTDILSNPPNARGARALLVDNKEYIKAEVINYINNKYVSFTYDETTCQRDVGYVIDAIGYDLMFGGNFQTITAARSYYRASASVAIGAQKAATIDAFTFLRDQILTVVSSSSAAVASVTANMNMFLDVITNGLGQEPAIVTPNPVGYDVNFQSARTLIANNRNFIKAEIIQFITNNYIGLSYDPAVCRRDVDYILDALYYDLTYGGNIQSLIAGKAYYSYTVLQVAAPEKPATLAAYGYLQSLVEDIALDIPVSALQVSVPQVRGTPGNVSASTTAGQRIGNIITIIDLGLGSVPATISPSTGWVAAGLTGANSALQSAKSTLQTDVTDYINANYTNTLVYDEVICKRDVGFIVAAVSADLLYGGTYLTIRAAQRYYVGTASSRVVLENQLAQTIDSFAYAKEVAQAVLSQVPPTLSYQELNGVTSPVTQVFNSDYDGSAFTTRAGELFDLLNEVITDPEVDVGTVLTGARPIVYPTYRLVMSTTTPVINNLEYTITGFVSKADSGVGDGSWDVVFNIITAPVAPLVKTRYRIFGNSNANYNNDAVECVASTTTRMTFRYPTDPGAFGSGTTTVEYVKNFQMLSAGNTSMCSNDFTQINDLGYGLVATNIGLIETVSVFSYYCWTAYYANNGGQIRSLNGSNAHGEFGIISEGSDPLEVPDKVNLSDNMMQVARVYKQDIYSTDSSADDLAVYFYQHDYAPYSVSEVEINHGSGVITELDNTSLVGGSLYTNGTYINVPLTGGTGSGATANIVISGNVVTTVALVSKGIRYSEGDILSCANTSVGGTGSGFFITVKTVIGNGIARYEVASVTDVSSTIPQTVSGTPVKTGPTGGKYYVTYSFSAVPFNPRIGIPYTVSGSSTVGFNGAHTATASSFTSVTLEYDTNPGTWAGGLATLWGLGNILRLNINTGGNNDTAANGLAVDLAHDQPIIIRGNQNFKFYEVDDTNPVRPSTALTFVGDPDAGAIVYRVLAYGNKGPLNENLAVDESILGFDTTYDYIKLLVNADNVDVSDSAKTFNLGATSGSTGTVTLNFSTTQASAPFFVGQQIKVAGVSISGYNGVKTVTFCSTTQVRYSGSTTGSATGGTVSSTLGSCKGDTKIAIDRVNETDVENRLNTGDMILAWDGKIHKILSYTDLGLGAGYAVVEIEDVDDKCLSGTATNGLNTPVDPTYNLDIAEPPTLRAGLTGTEPAEIIVRISTCRVTGHDFLDIGTGGYNDTNYPAKIYGAPKEPNQAREVQERTRGRCFYVTTDQDGIFRVGRFFTVDQGTGRVTFAASIALSNLDGLGFKRGVTVSEFSNDDRFTDGANDALPTEAATQGYIDRRLGMDRTNNTLDASQLIGPGYMDRAGILTFTGPDSMDMGGFNISNLASPVADTDAANKLYVRDQELSDDRVDTSTSPARSFNDLLVYNGTQWVNAETITTGDIQTSLSGKNLALNIKNGAIINTDVNASAAIAQSKLDMNAATTRANATGIAQADRGLASFKNTEFTATNGWIELQTSSSTTTGVLQTKLQYIANDTYLGNNTGSATYPRQVTSGTIVTNGDGIKNAAFAPGSVGSNGRAMILTAIGPNAYSTTNISTSAQASSLIQSDGSGRVAVAQLDLTSSSYKTLSVSGTTLTMTTPGTVDFLTAIGTSPAATTITTVGTLSVNALTSASTTTFSPANASVTLSPSGTGSVTIAPASVGTINNMNIGGTTRGSGAFTSLTANQNVTLTANSAVTGAANSTGTLQVTGGAGISGDLRVGGTIYGAITGSLAGTLGLSTYLSFTSGSTYDGSTSRTIQTNATSANTASTIMARDGNGDFNARYAMLGYVNTSDDTTTSTAVSGIMTKKGDNYYRTATGQQVATFLSGSSVNNWTIGTQLRMNANTSFRQSQGASWTGDAAAGEGKFEYHSNRWYANVGSDSTEIMRFRRGGSDVSWIDNGGTYNGRATSANYADLAEKYMADAVYETGTVMVFGGDAEVTVTDKHNDTRVAGVISEKPAHLMNKDLAGENAMIVGLTGRLPCKVIGKVKKGDILVTAAKKGYAIVNNTPLPGTIIGKSLENKDNFDEGLIEIVVGRF